MYNYSIAASASFLQSRYNVIEDDGFVQVYIILSSELSLSVTIHVFNTNGLATGKHIRILIKYCNLK